MSRDPGLPWFSAGALLCVLGLAVRFGGYEKDWRARVRPAPGGAELELELSARYFPASLEAAADDAARRLSAVKETCA